MAPSAFETEEDPRERDAKKSEPPVWVALTVIFLLTVGLVYLKAAKDFKSPTNAKPEPRTLVKDVGLAEANANDFFGIHDLLLGGFGGNMIEHNQSAGADEVREAAFNLTTWLPELHPVENCREEALAVRDRTPSSGRERVVEMANLAWSCLPAKFHAEDFAVPYLPEALDDFDLQKAAKNPRLSQQKKQLLGTCNHSSWTRTCSFWTSLHFMSARAEQAGTGADFLRSAVTTLAGGATQCKG